MVSEHLAGRADQLGITVRLCEQFGEGLVLRH